MEVAARATAGRQSPACVIALDPSQRKALGLTAKTMMETSNCTVQANSNHSEALTVGSNSSIIAGAVCVTGDLSIASTATVTPDPTSYCPPVPDPLATLEPPTYGACDYSNATYVDATMTLHPGVYCGGLKIDGDSKITLASGLYVIKDDKLDIRGNSVVNGEGVVFYLTGSKAVIFFGSKTSLALTASTSGPFAGILIFQDRAFGGNHIWDSGSPSELMGTIYLPGGNLLSKSSSSITPYNSCNVLIANTLQLTGGSDVSIDLSGSGCQSSLPSAVLGNVALLE